MNSGRLYKVYLLNCVSRGGRSATHVGIAIEPLKRLEDHKGGRVKATRGKIISLLGSTDSMPQGDALRLEARLKKLSREQKISWIEKNKT